MDSLNDMEDGRWLRTGDIFGEISILFGCRRTASIKAKQYCECTYIRNTDFLQLLANHQVYRSFLVKRIMRIYDDELRIFLSGCLKQVDYLKNVSDEIIAHIALNM